MIHSTIPITERDNHFDVLAFLTPLTNWITPNNIPIPAIIGIQVSINISKSQKNSTPGNRYIDKLRKLRRTPIKNDVLDIIIPLK